MNEQHPSRPWPGPPPGLARQPGPADAFEPRTYPQLLRGPRHTWWRPLVSMAVVLGLILVVLVLMTIAMVAGLFLSGSQVNLLDEDAFVQSLAAEPWFLLLNNLMLAAGIPVAMLGVWIGHGWRPRWVNSIGSRIRWRWLAVCSVVALAVQLLATAIFFAIDGVPQGRGTDVGMLLLIVFLTTPLQAAGEEYFFRGWLTQTLGSWFRNAMLSALVPALVTALLFALVHGTGQNLWLFLDRFAFGLLASYLTWRTGGLEAAIGAHAVNNIVVFIPVILTGTLAESLMITHAPWYLVVLDVVVMVVIGALIALLARRIAVQRTHDPSAQPGNLLPPRQPPWQGQIPRPGSVLVPPGPTG